MWTALTREVSLTIGQCELTHLPRRPIDPALAARQHRAYEQALAELGCSVRRLPAEPDLPDAVFVEDTAVVLDEVAVMARPGAASRRPEVASVAQALQAYRDLAWIEPPGTLEGGDVLRVGRSLYVGRSSRTNAAGIEQFRHLVERLGYRVHVVEVHGCLHLKSAVTLVAEGTLLIHRDWIDPQPLATYRLIDVDPAEPFAANALLVGGGVVYPSAYPRTRERLEREGIVVHTVDLTELAKAEGGVTCCSLIFWAEG